MTHPDTPCGVDARDVRDPETGKTPREAAEEVCSICRVNFRSIASLAEAMLSNAIVAGQYTAGIPTERAAITLCRWHARRQEAADKLASTMRIIFRDMKNSDVSRSILGRCWVKGMEAVLSAYDAAHGKADG